MEPQTDSVFSLICWSIFNINILKKTRQYHIDYCPFLLNLILITWFVIGQWLRCFTWILTYFFADMSSGLSNVK